MRPRLLPSALCVIALLGAETKPLQLNVIYECSPGSKRMKILNCDGDGDEAMCEVQSYTRAELGPQSNATRKQLMTKLKDCHVQTPTATFKPGERIQVLFEGRWIESKIEGTRGNDYMVTLPENRTTWTTATYIRHLASAPKPGLPYKPGFTSCAGRIEGSYASTSGELVSIEFRSGKAIIRDDSIPYWECWISGTTIILHVPNEQASGAQDQKIDINNDGTLETPLGELKKKGN